MTKPNFIGVPGHTMRACGTMKSHAHTHGAENGRDSGRIPALNFDEYLHPLGVTRTETKWDSRNALFALFTKPHTKLDGA